MINELRQVLNVNRKLQVTVWDPADQDREYTFPSYVMSTAGLLFMIAPPAGQIHKIMPLLQRDIQLCIVVETYPNPLIFYPVILSEPSPPKQQGYWMKIPPHAEIEVLQRRRHVRIPMILPLEVEYTLGGTIKQRLPANTEDMSGGGMRLTCVRPFPVGQELRLHLKLGVGSSLLQLTAKVVSSAENRLLRQPGDLYTTACEFVGLSNANEMAIVRECFRRELKKKQ